MKAGDLKRLAPAGVIAVLACFVGARFIYLTADPPILFIKYSQSLLTDPYYYTYFARNAVLFGDWIPFGYDRYAVFMSSLVSGASYIVFSLFGVSRLTAHLTSLLLHLGGIGLFVAAVYDRRRPLLATFTAFFALSCVSLFFFSRYPLLENGMLFWIGLLCFVFFRFHHTKTGQILSGTVVALAALTGKLIAAMMLAPVVVCLLVLYRSRAVVPIILTAAGSAVTFGLYLLVFFHGSLSTFLEYLAEVQVTVNGAPGFMSLKAWLSQFTSYLAMPHLNTYHTVLLLAGLTGAAVFILNPRAKLESRERLAVLFAGIWLLVALLVLSPLGYRPTRHALFLFLPFALLTAFLCEHLIKGELAFSTRAWWRWMIAGLCIFLGLAVVLGRFFENTSSGRLMADWAPWLLVAAICITAVTMWLVRRHKRIVGGTSSIVLLVVILGLAALQSIYYIFTGLSHPSYEIVRLNREIGQLLKPDAVVVGNLAPALTTDNEVKGVFEFFGPVPTEERLFDRYPITHLITNSPLWPEISTRYHLEDRNLPLFVHTILGAPAKVNLIYRPRYELSEFERALEYLGVGSYDRGLTLINRLLSRYPDNGTLLITRILFLMPSATYNELINEIHRLGNKFHNSLYTQYTCAMFMAALYHVNGSPSLLRQVKFYVGRANALDPRLGATVESILEKASNL
jgi:4-amino-4-deoxy-L-arabinose transferase-like glycosyltransferase